MSYATNYTLPTELLEQIISDGLEAIPELIRIVVNTATPLSNDRELRGQMDQAITAHAYPPTVWSAGEVVEDHVQIGAANLQAGRYAVWRGLYSPATLERVAVEAGAGEVIEDRARLLEFQIGP